MECQLALILGCFLLESALDVAMMTVATYGLDLNHPLVRQTKVFADNICQQIGIALIGKKSAHYHQA
jgi:hypothetical protein